MARRIQDSLDFDSLHLEGGLFVPAIIDLIARGENTHQKPTDYQLPKGLSLTDEQGRAFRIATALWKNLSQVRERTDVDAHQATVGFVRDLLRDAFGCADIEPAGEAVGIFGRTYPLTFSVRGRVPVIVAPHDIDLDTPDERFAVAGSGTRRRSAYQLAQQFLNASRTSTWAIVTNGHRIRLLRDADTLTRPAFLSIDLELILRDQRYADFAAAWRILHASRAGDPESPGGECIWEKWKAEGHDQGTRVRDAMRDGVTKALQTLGNGFLEHRDNDALRQEFSNGTLNADAYFQELLRLVYRFLFVFTIEERGILHPPDDSAEARHAHQLYADGYALRRLRNRSLRRKGFDRFHDLWDGVRVVFRGLREGQPRLALPALGGLFANDQCPHLDAARIDNRRLLTAMRHLRWSSVSGQLTAVDYRNMGPEELGSVYESLLELVPEVRIEVRQFSFIGLDEGLNHAGNSRKTTGSYYTPDALVQQLLDTALDPVIEERIHARPNDPVQALLDIKVVDPACGSGHFLLGAARRLAEKLTELRSIEGAMRSEDYYHSLREVIAHCIHGVDRNPMALELARTALWLEGYEPGLPLTFLDHHLVCGDALLGLTDFRQLQAGIPKEAFKPLSGDNKTVAKELAVTNRKALTEWRERMKDKSAWLIDERDSEDVFKTLQALEAMPDESTEAVEQKKQAYADFLRKAKDSPLSHAADLFVAAFLAPKSDPESIQTCPTTRSLTEVLFPERDTPFPEETVSCAQALCHEARVLHWPLAFAPVMGKGGFDCVLANPPWERIKIQEKEFFAARHPEIATAQNKAVRERLIRSLENGSEWEQALYGEFMRSRRISEAMSEFAHIEGSDGGRFARTGVGDVNTYSLFAETISSINASTGHAGFIVPTGIATDDSTKEFFAHLVENRRLTSLFDFENREGIFPGVHRSYKFCLMTLGPAREATFAFFLTRTEHLDDERRQFQLRAEDFRLINPNTLTCPVFRSQADAELTKKIYRQVPVLIREPRDGKPEENPWRISFATMFHMSNDSHHFLNRPRDDAQPLYEAKMMHQFDHRWGSYRWDATKGTDGEYVIEDVPPERKKDRDYQVQPRYWVPEREVIARLARAPRGVIRAWAADDPDSLLATVASWITAGLEDDLLAEMKNTNARQQVVEHGGPAFEDLPKNESDWLETRIVTDARNWDPLSPVELNQIREAPYLDVALHRILDHRSPRWIMGWRDITNATNERTVIASVLPKTGCGNGTIAASCPPFFERQAVAGG